MKKRSPYALVAEAWFQTNGITTTDSKTLWDGMCAADPVITTPDAKRKTPRSTAMRDLRQDLAFSVGSGTITFMGTGAANIKPKRTSKPNPTTTPATPSVTSPPAKKSNKHKLSPEEEANRKNRFIRYFTLEHETLAFAEPVRVGMRLGVLGSFRKGQPKLRRVERDDFMVRSAGHRRFVVTPWVNGTLSNDEQELTDWLLANEERLGIHFARLNRINVSEGNSVCVTGVDDYFEFGNAARMVAASLALYMNKAPTEAVLSYAKRLTETSPIAEAMRKLYPNYAIMKWPLRSNMVAENLASEKLKFKKKDLSARERMGSVGVLAGILRKRRPDLEPMIEDKNWVLHLCGLNPEEVAKDNEAAEKSEE